MSADWWLELQSSTLLKQLHDGLHGVAAVAIAMTEVGFAYRLLALACVGALWWRGRFQHRPRWPRLRLVWHAPGEAVAVLDELPATIEAVPCFAIKQIEMASVWFIVLRVIAQDDRRVWLTICRDQCDDVTYKRLLRALIRERERRLGAGYRWLRWLRG